MRYLVSLLTTGMIILLWANILPGIRVHDYFTALLVAFVMEILNWCVRPFLLLISLPITVFTMGLFLFVINAVILLLTKELVTGFYISGLGSALLLSVCLSFSQSIVQKYNQR